MAKARLKAQERRVKFKRYQKMLLRAVKRQILLNAHKRALLKDFKVSSAMVLAMDAGELNIEEEKPEDYYLMNAKISMSLSEILYFRLQDHEVIDLLEEITILIQTNQKKVD